MLAQKGKKIFLAKIFCIFITHLIKTLNSLDSSRLNRRLSQNPNKGGCRELFLPKNDFKNFKIFQKNGGFGGLETNQRHEI